MILLYRILLPFVISLLPVAAAVSPKIRAGLRLRLKPARRPTFTTPPVWIHAASGEFEYAKPVIRELRRTRPDVPIVVTYFSPTYARNVADFPGVAHAEALPLDLPGPCGAFLDAVRPRACLIARTDFWPELLTQAGRRGIPRTVFAYTRAPVAGWRRHVVRRQLSLVDHILTVTNADHAATMALAPAATVEVTGDPRYDQVAERLANPRPLPAVMKPPGPCLVAGSTWPADEAVLLPALAPLLKDGRLRMIVVPHEPTPAHVADLGRALDKLGLSHRLFSRGREWSDAQVLVVDATGVLAELYAWGEFAFVGGSFRKSVHSVMEALGAGAVTFVGPRHRNNREAVEFAGLVVNGRPGLEVVTDVAQFRDRITARLSDEEPVAFQNALRAEFDARRGAARRVAERI